jgi:putative membrane protein insertion efficiency factor
MTLKTPETPTWISWVAAVTHAPQHLLMAGVRAYRFFLKPWLGNACRFEPTCSQYALTALQEHGALKGSALTAGRLLRCHPWCEGGCDPVPPRPLFPRSDRNLTP